MVGRHRTTAAVALANLALALVAARAAPAGPPAGDAADEVRSFVSVCGFSHRNSDDPIALPGQAGFAQDNTYVGNDSTSAFSTLKSLRTSGTTCDRVQDLSAYWTPSLVVDGKPVDPLGAVIYFRRLTKAPVRPYPNGLVVVAGDARAYEPQSRRVVFWDCSPLKTTLRGPKAPGRAQPAASTVPPVCPPASRLQLHVNFPDCWNGRAIDSIDHARHMAYSVAGRCPRSHPVAVPELSIVMQYPPETGKLTLSSGTIYSAHGDFVNAWGERALKTLVTRCLDKGRQCGTGAER